MSHESEADHEMSLRIPHESLDQTNFQIEQAPTRYLRLADSIFCFVQVLTLAVYWMLLSDSMPHMLLSRIKAASFGVVFFMARRESFATDVGRNAVRLFLLHSTGSLLIALYEHLCSPESFWAGMLRHITILLQAFWVLCDMLAIRSTLGLLILRNLPNSIS